MEKGDRFTNRVVEGQMQKVLDEDIYRKKIVIVARTMGCLPQALQIFAKYDGLLQNCTNKSERQAIQTMGIKAMSDLLDGGYVGANGKVVVIHDDESIVLVDDYKSKRDAGFDN
jgi:hypothetical protein